MWTSSPPAEALLAAAVILAAVFVAWLGVTLSGVGPGDGWGGPEDDDL